MDRDLRAFTIEAAAELTGLSIEQLRRWAKDGFFKPSAGEGDGPFFYSFRDLVGLRTIRDVRARGVSLQSMKPLGKWLRERYEDPWSTLSFSLEGKRLLFTDPESGAAVQSKPMGQSVARETIKLEKIAHELERRVEDRRRRSKESIGQVSQRRGVQGNQLCVAGTRIPVAAVWDLHDAGMNARDICRQYPTLTVQDVTAAIQAARRRAS